MEKTVSHKIGEEMKDILKRLASPVVIAQIIVTVVGVLVFFMPNQSEAIQIVSGAIVAIVNLFAGLNNPADKKSF